jgi:hypothetical protein
MHHPARGQIRTQYLTADSQCLVPGPPGLLQDRGRLLPLMNRSGNGAPQLSPMSQIQARWGCTRSDAEVRHSMRLSRVERAAARLLKPLTPQCAGAPHLLRGIHRYPSRCPGGPGAGNNQVGEGLSWVRLPDPDDTIAGPEIKNESRAKKVSALL